MIISVPWIALGMGCAWLVAADDAGPTPDPEPAPAAPGGPPAEPEPAPADTWPAGLPRPAGNEVAPPIVPIFVPPVRGDVKVTGTFDHNYPDTIDKRQLTGWGELTYGRSAHRGHDMVVKVGTPLYAMGDGEVVFAGDKGPAKCGGGRVDKDISVRIRHTNAGDGHLYESKYLHMSEVAVAEGEQVTAGQLIGASGNTGCSSGPHLHFAVMREVIDEEDSKKKKKKDRFHAVDPWGWWSPDPDPWAAKVGPSPYMWKERPLTFQKLSGDDDAEGPVIFDYMVNATWRNNALPNQESVVLGVPGKRKKKSVDLGGFTLTNKAGESWAFPDITLKAGERITVHSGKGDDTADTVYMGRARGMWDDAVDCAVLRAPDGRLVDQLPWGRKKEKPCDDG